jgi:hypothetical protein
LAKEDERNQKINSMYYYQSMSNGGSVCLREAIDLARKDLQFYEGTEIGKETPEGMNIVGIKPLLAAIRA